MRTAFSQISLKLNNETSTQSSIFFHPLPKKAFTASSLLFALFVFKLPSVGDLKLQFLKLSKLCLRCHISKIIRAADIFEFTKYFNSSYYKQDGNKQTEIFL